MSRDRSMEHSRMSVLEPCRAKEGSGRDDGPVWVRVEVVSNKSGGGSYQSAGMDNQL